MRPSTAPAEVAEIRSRPMQKEGDFSEEVLIALRKIIHATDLHSKQTAKHSGLTIPQIVVLKTVRELGEVTTRQISRRVSLSQATVTSVLDRLEKNGLVQRYRSMQDRRIVHTKLTRKGGAALRTAPRLLQERFLDRFERLPARQQKEFVTTLNRIADMMGVSDLDAAPLLAVGAMKQSSDK